MKAFLPFLVIGITTGAIYALAAMGLVLTYTTSGVFNFAHGAVGMLVTYLFYSLRVDAGWPTPLALAVALLVVAPLLGMLIDRVLLTRLAGATTATYVVVSLSLLVAIQGGVIAVYGAETRKLAPLFPTSTFRFADVNVGYDQAFVVAIAVAAGLALAHFFSRTHLGLKTKAVVGDPELTELVGSSARAITTISWVLGTVFAALSGILMAPVVGLDAVLLTLLVVQAFGAAVVGRLRSLPLTNLGAYGVAVVAALSTKYVANYTSLIGLPTALPFIVLFGVLIFSPKSAFVEVTERTDVRRLVDRPGARGRRNGQYGRLAAVIAAAALAPLVLSGPRLLTATTTAAYVLIFASLGLLVGLSRQLSLCHAVFVVFGATTLSHLLSAGVPYPVALLVAALTMVPVGAALAIPAIRLSGLFLALATFGFGVLAQYLLFNLGLAFGRDAVGVIPRPEMLTGDTAFFYFVLAVVAGSLLLIEIVRSTRLGRVLAAVADSPSAVQSVGINPTASRVMVFCLSAFFAALAGGLLGSLVRVVTPTSFDFFQSLVWVTVLVIAGARGFAGSIVAAVLLIAVPAVFTSAAVTEWQPVVFGISAIMLARSSNGIVGLVRRPEFDRLTAGWEWRREDRRLAERRARVVGELAG